MGDVGFRTGLLLLVLLGGLPACRGRTLNFLERESLLFRADNEEIRVEDLEKRYEKNKARADRLALGMTHDRPYADHEVRRALYNSGIASSGYDRRLRDLLIPGNNDGGSLRPTSGSAGAGGPTAVDVNVSSGQPVRKVPRLDTAMNPLTNQPMTWTPRRRAWMFSSATFIGASPKASCMVSTTAW